MLLEIENLSVSYGAIQALQAVNLTLEVGEIVTLIGANGAGKSTLLRTISGLLPARSGKIRFWPREEPEEALDLLSIPAHEIVPLGICQVPEGREIFANLTVYENLRIGAYRQRDEYNFQQDLEHVFQLFPRLKERLRQNAGTLSGGEQQMLAIGRALMARPYLLLLDEPSLGLAPVLVEMIFETIQNINQAGTTILLVEQNARLALALAHRGYVLETGRVVLSGASEELEHNDLVRQAYLGES